jgi:uncharacterized protein
VIGLAASLVLMLVHDAAARGARMSMEQARAALAEDPRDPEVVGLFVGAASQGNLREVRAYLDAGVDIDAPSPRHQRQPTALMAAIEGVHPDTARFLIARGADLDVPNSRGVTPLLLTIRMARRQPGYDRLAAELLRKGANPNASDVSGWSPLIRAAEESNDEIAQMLLERGADVHHTTELGETALHRAGGWGLEVARLLLEHGADPNAVTREGRTPLMVAVERGWIPVGDGGLAAGFTEQPACESATTSGTEIGGSSDARWRS